MALQSKYWSTCPLCHKRIKKGDWIDNKNDLNKWAHVKCGTVENEKKPNASLSGVNQLLDEGSEKKKSDSFSTSFTPSKYQVGIFDFIVNGKGHGVVEAVAGSGKTTTIVKALEYLPLAALVQFTSLIERPTPLDLSLLDVGKNKETAIYILKNKKIAFLAFNKHIATALKENLQYKGIDYVHASTLHSLGYQLLIKKFAGIQMDEDKLGVIMDEFWNAGKMIVVDGKEVEWPDDEYQAWLATIKPVPAPEPTEFELLKAALIEKGVITESDIKQEKKP